jgi:predicted PolB exonuclease-like 3'-5' exonuclease
LLPEACRAGQYAGDWGKHRFEKIGWERKVDLGLSIGCLYSYQDDRYTFFDAVGIEATMRQWLHDQPRIVTYNGEKFDAPLLRAILRYVYDGLPEVVAPDRRQELTDLCDAFKAYMATTQSYDILAHIWRVDAANRFGRGLNSLGAISQANGWGSKEMDGATAPVLWAQGRYAEVALYCAGIVAHKQLFDRICTGQSFLRGDGLPITLPVPVGMEVGCAE